MNSHRRQSSNGSFSLDQTHFQASFSSLDNFMFVSKLMQDEIMVPSKLKDKHFGECFEIILESKRNCCLKIWFFFKFLIKEKITSIPENEDISKVELPCTDVLDHYRFISMLRNQFMQPNPFTSLDEDSSKELKSKQFKKKTSSYLSSF